MRVLFALLSLALSAPGASGSAGASAVSVDVSGDIQDVVEGVVAGVPTVVVSSTVTSSVTASGPASGPASKRVLTFVDVATRKARPGPAVPAAAVSFAVCGGGVVFVDDRGLVDVDGQRLIARAPLLPVADPTALFSAEVCPSSSSGAQNGMQNADERVLAVKDGLVVVRLKDGAVVDERVLPFSARARAYSGRGPRSLRGERPYALALSLYVPRLFAVDVDGDRDLDLLALHEGHLALFRRTPAGLSTTPEERDLLQLLGVGGGGGGGGAGGESGADLRVRFAGPRAFVSVSRGAVPAESRIVVVDGSAERPFSKVAASRSIEGLAVLLGVVGSDPVVGRLDTTLVALSGVVLTGRVSVNVSVAGDDVLSLQAAADVRAGKMDGALPIVDVDIDGDGTADLVDLGEPGRAVVYRGERASRGPLTFGAASPVAIPRFTLVVPLPSSSAVALVSAPSKGKSKLTLLTR